MLDTYVGMPYSFSMPFNTPRNKGRRRGPGLPLRMRDSRPRVLAVRGSPIASTRRYLCGLGPLPEPEVRRALDVRHLVVCVGCQCLADERHCVLRAGKPYHGRCFLRRFGLRALQAMSPAARGGLQLADIGMLAARVLIAGDAAAAQRQ